MGSMCCGSNTTESRLLPKAYADLDVNKYYNQDQIEKTVDKFYKTYCKDFTPEMDKDTTAKICISSVNELGKVKGGSKAKFSYDKFDDIIKLLDPKGQGTFRLWHSKYITCVMVNPMPEAPIKK